MDALQLAELALRQAATPLPGGTANVKPMDALRILRSASSALFAQAALHGQLAKVEWAQEKNRLLKMLVVILAGFACLLCLMLFGGAFMLAISWETVFRIPVAVALLVCYALGIATACYCFGRLALSGEQAFAATREEIAVDIALIRSKL